MSRHLLAGLDRARIWLVAAYGRQRLGESRKAVAVCTAGDAAARSWPPLHCPNLDHALGDKRLRLWVDAHSRMGLDAVMFGVYEPASMPRLLQLAKQLRLESPTFIDVGANLGFYSIALALSARGARVLACEPGPAAAALCA